MEDPESSFHVLSRRAGTSGIPIDFFEPAGQPGVLVVGAVVTMKNRQTARYLRYTDAEKERFRAQIRAFCDSIRAVCRIMDEAGKQRVGLYVVLDGKERILQGDVFGAVARVSEMHEKATRFLRTL